MAEREPELIPFTPARRGPVPTGHSGPRALATRVPEVVHDRYTTEAKRRGQKLSDLIRDALDAYLPAPEATTIPLDK